MEDQRAIMLDACEREVIVLLHSGVTKIGEVASTWATRSSSNRDLVPGRVELVEQAWLVAAAGKT